MRFLTVTTFASIATSTLAATPARRDEWQPWNSSVSYPTGAPVPAPTVHPGTGWEPQGNQTCIYITTDYEWHGHGMNLCNPAGVCANKLPDGFSGKLLSAGPSKNQACFLYSEEYCAGMTSDPIVNPGYSNLDAISFGNIAKSWMCFKLSPANVPISSASSASTTSASSSPAVQTIATVVGTVTIWGTPSQSISTTAAVQTITSTMTMTVVSLSPVPTSSGTVYYSATAISTTSSATGSAGIATPTVSSLPQTTALSTSSAGPSGFFTTFTSVSSSAYFSFDPISSTSSSAAGFSFDPISSTMVTHTYADGKVTTTFL